MSARSPFRNCGDIEQFKNDRRTTMDRRRVLRGLVAAMGLAVSACVGAWALDAKPPDQPKSQATGGASDPPNQAALTPSLRKLLGEQAAVLKEIHRIHKAAGAQSLSPGVSYDIENEYLWSRRLLEVEGALGEKK